MPENRDRQELIDRLRGRAIMLADGNSIWSKAALIMELQHAANVIETLDKKLTKIKEVAGA